MITDLPGEEPKTACAVCIGNFDGVHAGHRALIEKAGRVAKESGLHLVIMTFSEHPMQVLRSGKEPFRLLLTGEEKRALLQAFLETLPGEKTLCFLPFTKELSRMEPEIFVREFLCEQLFARKIVLGEDFRFGAGGKGDSALLQKLMKSGGPEPVIVEKKRSPDGAVISSSRIRTLVEEGKCEEAEALLGRPFSLSGKVEHGKGLGRTLGFPTLNLPIPPEKCVPKKGVYASETRLDGESFTSITNVGCGPTFGGKEVRWETFLVSPKTRGDLYGKKAEIFLKSFIRPEKTFESAEALKGQIEKDIKILLGGNA